MSLNQIMCPQISTIFSGENIVQICRATFTWCEKQKQELGAVLFIEFPQNKG